MSAALSCIAFAPEHLEAFAAAPVFAADGGTNPDDAVAAVTAGPAWTLCLAGRPIACGGVVLLWRGVGEAWSLSAAGLGPFALRLHRIVAARLAEAEAQYGLHRIQASVRTDNGEGRRWLARLHFWEEGEMKGYGPMGHDFMRLARGRLACPTA